MDSGQDERQERLDGKGSELVPELTKRLHAASAVRRHGQLLRALGCSLGGTEPLRESVQCVTQ